MENQFFKKYFLDCWFNFLVWVVVAAMIFLMFTKISVGAAILAEMIWNFLWLITYADHISNVAVKSYREQIYKETFATTAELKKDTDIFLGLE